MKLETKRLWIVALDYEQLLLCVKADGSLENELGIIPKEKKVPLELAEAFKNTILPMVEADRENYLFHTIWTIISKKDKVIVADLCFKGKPNEKGEIEVGYGTYDAFQNKGYMTEAINGILAWALNAAGVKCVIAETNKNNIPSQKILIKNNFKKYKEEEKTFWWRLEK